MPSSLTLCWRFCPSNTVIVSPSLTPTTLPMTVCGCHVGSKSEIRVGVGDDGAINTAELVGGGSIALQPTSNRPKTHAAHLFGLPDLSGSSVISLRGLRRLCARLEFLSCIVVFRGCGPAELYMLQLVRKEQRK